MAILSASDFTSGVTKIAGNQFSSANINASIDENWEQLQIKRMLGSTEGQSFIDDLVDGEPQTAKYVTIFNEFLFNYGNIPYECIGIKEILKRLFYCEYLRQQENINTGLGNKIGVSEASNDLFIHAGHTLWNEAAANVDNLQGYCRIESDTYTDFEFVYRYQMVSPI